MADSGPRPGHFSRRSKMLPGRRGSEARRKPVDLGGSNGGGATARPPSPTAGNVTYEANSRRAAASSSSTMDALASMYA